MRFDENLTTMSQTKLGGHRLFSTSQISDASVGIAGFSATSTFQLVREHSSKSLGPMAAEKRVCSVSSVAYLLRLKAKLDGRERKFTH
jgi:hypothetical protein